MYGCGFNVCVIRLSIIHTAISMVHGMKLLFSEKQFLFVPTTLFGYINSCCQNCSEYSISYLGINLCY